MEIERRADGQQHRSLELADVRRHPSFLLGSAETHPHQIGLGRVDAGDDVCPLLVGQVTEWWRVRARDPETGKDISLGNSWKADVIIDKSYPENANLENYRDFALYFQDEDNILGTSFMPYLQNVAGLTGVNYRLEPWTYREDEGCELGNMFTPCVAADSDPATPVLKAHAGDKVMINVFGAHNEQNQMFNLDGHQWRRHLNQEGSDMIDVEEFGSGEWIQAYLLNGAGGTYHNPGTYLWLNARTPYQQAGQWGYFKVLPKGDRSLLPLGGATPGNLKSASKPQDERLSMR